MKRINGDQFTPVPNCSEEETEHDDKRDQFETVMETLRKKTELYEKND